MLSLVLLKSESAESRRRWLMTCCSVSVSISAALIIAAVTILPGASIAADAGGGHLRESYKIQDEQSFRQFDRGQTEIDDHGRGQRGSSVIGQIRHREGSHEGKDHGCEHHGGGKRPHGYGKTG